MKLDIDFFLENRAKCESRGEAKFFQFCCDHQIQIEPKPQRIYADPYNSWSPDFYLPEYGVYIEIKPLRYWFEIERIKPVICRAIDRGNRFWVWFVDNEWRHPRIYEWTHFREEIQDPIEKQMKTFIKRIHPEDLEFLEDKGQLLLFTFIE